MKKGEKKRSKKIDKKKISIKKTILYLIIILISLTLIFIVLRNIVLTTNAVEDGNCIPNWKCTPFSPEKCPEDGKRIRECIDLNECGILQDKPELNETCEKKNYTIPVLIGILGIGTIILIIIILGRIIRKNEKLLERPKAENRHYKKDPNYPSEVEQYYGSDQTHNFKDPKKKKSKPETPEEADGQEKFPARYWPK